MPAATAIRVTHRADGVCVFTLDQPGRSTNILLPDLWRELSEKIANLTKQLDVRGLILTSAKPGVFIAGADLRFLANLPGPNFPAARELIELGLRVLDQLEALPFPTCAAINGVALGGGLEVALACDFRVTATRPPLELALPEVKFGLIPGWGGTQRLPRIIGLDAAVVALTTGQEIRNETWDEFDFVDAEADGECLLDCCASHVLNGAEKSQKRRERKRNPIPATERELYRSPKLEGSEAVRELLDVVERGAALPLNNAIGLETEAFLRLAGSGESKRLISEFFASRKR